MNLQSLLAGYEMPRRIEVLEALPRTPGPSKVQRYRLQELAARLLGT